MKKSELKLLIKECLTEAKYRNPDELSMAMAQAVDELADAAHNANRKGDPAMWAEKYSRSAPAVIETIEKLIVILEKMAKV